MILELCQEAKRFAEGLEILVTSLLVRRNAVGLQASLGLNEEMLVVISLSWQRYISDELFNFNPRRSPKIISRSQDPRNW